MKGFLIVYLNRIRQNIWLIKKRTNKKIMAVVKSNAYGLGTKAIIPFLINNGVDFLVFNQWEEYLKDQMVSDLIPVLVLSSLDHFKYLQSANLENLRISINNLNDAIRLINYLKKTPLNQPVKVHLQVDTGMNRYGIRDFKEFQIIIKLLKTSDQIIIEGLYTHYASDYREYQYFDQQNQLFKKYYQYHQFSIIHGSASASLNKPIIGNYVRVGIGLYGFNRSLKLLPAVNVVFKTKNSFQSDQPLRLSYDGIYTSKVNQQIGIIDWGYYEGLNSYVVYHQNQPIPIVGKIGMNHACLDLGCKDLNNLNGFQLLPRSIKLSQQLIKASNINFHKFITDLKAIPKIYQETYYDLSKTNFYLSKKSPQTKLRIRRY